MTWLASSDPQALLALYAGVVPPTVSANGQGDLATADQRAAQLGDPIPVVWARWRNGAGGVLLSPPATELRYETPGNGQIQASYHLILGEGPMSAIEVRDVFSGAIRAGSFNQSYNRRAGTWLPGNFITDLSVPEIAQLSQYCGSVGTYPGVSTLSYQIQTALANDAFKRQVNIFIRGGINVTRLADGVYGPSDNFADLILWLMQRSSRIPAEMIDIPALTATAVFLERQGFTCNCVITERTSIPDLIAAWGPYFLVTESRNNGKLGLRPVLPTDAQGNILTGPLTYAYRFNADNTIPDSLEINYSSLGNRQPFTVQSRWRQQPANDLGIARVLETRYAGTAEAGPFELHDLSAFATNELHAARVGAHLLARRCQIDHTARLRARPGGHSTTLSPGAVVRVTLPREASSGGDDTWDYLYQVERISKTLAGDVAYELTHLPVDAARRSLVALDVVSAVGTGILLSPQRSGILQDVNSSTDGTVPPDVGISANSTAASGAAQAGQPEEIDDSRDSAEPPTGPEDGPGEGPDGGQSGPTRSQTTPDAPAVLEPIVCDSGQPPEGLEWFVRPNPYTDYKPYPAAGRTGQPLLPIQPGSQPQERRVLRPGGQFYAKYWCPEPGDPPRDPSKIRYSREYTVTPQDTAPFEPLGSGGNSVAYKIRILRNDGPPWNPVYWDEAVSSLAYHHIIFIPTLVTGYQNLPYDYTNPSDPAHASILWNVAQGPSIIAFDIVNFFIGPTASLPAGTMQVTPPDWVGYAWGQDGKLRRVP